MPPKDFIVTESGNVICKPNKIKGSKHIVIGGKTHIEKDVEIRGDLSPDGKPIVAIGRYCYFGEKTSLEPPSRDGKAYPLKIGSYVWIGSNTKVQAASVGSHVLIEKNVEIGPFAVIKDCVVVREGTKIPSFGVVAPHSAVNGMDHCELPESAQAAIELYCRQTLAGLNVPAPF